MVANHQSGEHQGGMRRVVMRAARAHADEVIEMALADMMTAFSDVCFRG
jgi:hypothetical protein